MLKDNEQFAESYLTGRNTNNEYFNYFKKCPNMENLRENSHINGNQKGLGMYLLLYSSGRNTPRSLRVLAVMAHKLLLI